MNKQILRLIAPLAITAFTVNLAFADNSSPVAKNSNAVDECIADSDCYVLDDEDVFCGMIIPPNVAKAGGYTRYVIADDIACPLDYLQSQTDNPHGSYPNPNGSFPNAAVSIIGDDLDVIVAGNINCSGIANYDQQVAAYTNDLHSMAIYVGGEKNHVEGYDSVLSNCTVMIEVNSVLQGLVFPRLGTEQNTGFPVSINNTIEGFSGYDFAAGVRLNSDRNKVKHVSMQSGIFSDNDDPVTSELAGITAGYVIGIKALDTDDNATCHVTVTSDPGETDDQDPVPPAAGSHEAVVPSVYHNIIEHSDAMYNDYGFLGGNEMDLTERPDVTNRIQHNHSSKNGTAGILLVGTGFVVEENHAYQNGFSQADFKSGGAGIIVSLNNPACNYNFQNSESPRFEPANLNYVVENTTNNNRVIGIAAISALYGAADDTNSVPLYDYTTGTLNPNWSAALANAGTRFEFNRIKDKHGDVNNGLYSYLDENGECASGQHAMNQMNFWRHNEYDKGTIPTFAPDWACVGN